MKALLFLLLALTACAADTYPLLKTTKGVEFKNARVTEVEADGITIFHAGGVAKVMFRELSADLQKKYGYDPKRAAAAERADAAEQAALARKARIDAEIARRLQRERDEETAEAMRAAEAKRVAGGSVGGGSDALRPPDAGPRPAMDGLSLAEQQAVRKAAAVERIRRQLEREEDAKDAAARK